MADFVFRPSAASRWLRCTGSMRPDMRVPDRESPYAAEGTFGHAVAEWALKNDIPLPLYEHAVKIPDFAKSKFFTEELCRSVGKYVDYVRGIEGERRYEVKLSYGHVIPDQGGTSDTVVIDPLERILHIADLKMGRGVEVSAEENEQEGIYALAALAELCFDLPIDKVRLHIIQPRLGVFEAWDAPVEWLFELSERMKAAYERVMLGQFEFVPGTKQCRWCPASGACSARAEWVTQIIAGRLDPCANWSCTDARLLTPQELEAYILPHLDTLEAFVKSVRSHATNLAVDFPGIFDRWKLVESNTRRRWAFGDAEIARFLMEDCFLPEDDVYERSVIGISDAERKLGKRKGVLASLIEKPPGKPTLVPVEDERESIDPQSNVVAELSD